MRNTIDYGEREMSLKVEGETEEIGRFVRRAKGEGRKNGGGGIDFSFHHFIPEGLVQESENEEKMWLLEHWGVSDDVDAEYSEETQTYQELYMSELAMVAFLEISKQFPSLKFILEGREHKRIKTTVFGKIVFQNGKIVSDFEQLGDIALCID
jgi:hypothetical protein